MFQIHTIGDPWQNVNLFFFQHADDTRELSTAVPAGADRYLIPMKMGIIDHDRFLGQSNETRRPEGATKNKLLDMDSALPVASNTTSANSPSVCDEERMPTLVA